MPSLPVTDTWDKRSPIVPGLSRGAFESLCHDSMAYVDPPGHVCLSFLFRFTFACRHLAVLTALAH